MVRAQRRSRVPSVPKAICERPGSRRHALTPRARRYLDGPDGGTQGKGLKHQYPTSWGKDGPEKIDIRTWYSKAKEGVRWLHRRRIAVCALPPSAPHTRRQRAATKYRKGACENCGAMTHKVKDCVERPRAKGARLTGRDIKVTPLSDRYECDRPHRQPDEVIEDVKLDYDGKRDRWNGYDPASYKRVIDRASDCVPPAPRCP
jgi:hypothetical protein